MSNHYHLVLRIDPISAQSWSLDEVIQRWLYLHKGPFLIQQYQKDKTLDKVEINVITKIVDDWRARLSSISECMQQLNQVIA